jgi:hypothetical protein
MALALREHSALFFFPRSPGSRVQSAGFRRSACFPACLQSRGGRGLRVSALERPPGWGRRRGSRRR